MTATAAEWNLTVDQGAYWSKVITYETGATFDAVTPVNLTGYTARLKIRRKGSSDPALLSLTHASGITLGGAAGTITVVLTAAQTAALPTGADLVYDLDVIDGSSRPYRLVRGKVTVQPGESHEA